MEISFVPLFKVPAQKKELQRMNETAKIAATLVLHSDGN